MNEQQKILFESLHQLHHNMVVQMCRGFMKGDRELADDLTQEVFINVWNALPKFRDEASHKTWIYRITVNTCLLHIRREKGKQKETVETVEHLAHESTDTSQVDALYVAIGQLEEVERLIIMMVLDELEQETIARVMGMNLNNLRVKIHRIKTKLKNILKNER
jgi:RNA polymerase sigma factor (sigma-70 family)